MRPLLTCLLLCLCLRADTVLVTAPGHLYRVDPTHATVTSLSPTGIWFDLARSASGRWYASDSESLYRLDPSTGSATLIGEMQQFVNGMTFAGSTLYASGGCGLFTIDTDTGLAHVVGYTGFASSGDLEFFAGALYMTAMGPGNSSDLLVRLDPLTGQGALIGTIGFSGVMGLASADGRLWGFTRQGDLLSLDPATGVGTRRASLGIMAYGASRESVPEPATVCLLGCGLLAVARCVRRR